MNKNSSRWCALGWNCNSLDSIKQDQLNIIADSHSYPPHSRLTPSAHLSSQPLFIALTETKLTPLHTTPHLSDYNCYTNPAQLLQPPNPHTVSGGLLLYVKSSISSEHRPVLQHHSPYCLLVQTSLPLIGRCIIGVFYHRVNDIDSLSSIFRSMSSACSTGLPVFFVGDFNSRHESWCTRTEPAGTRLFDYCNSNSLFVMNPILAPRRPTRPSTIAPHLSSTIDLLITSHPHFISALQPSGSVRLSSDHLPLVFGGPVSKQQHIDRPPPYYRWRVEKGDWLGFTELQQRVITPLLPRFHHLIASSSPSLHQTTIDQIWNELCDVTLFAAHQKVGQCYVSDKSREHLFWKEPGVSDANKRYHHALRNYSHHRTPANHTILLNARSHFRFICYTAKQNVWSKLCRKLSDPANSKIFWNTFRSTLTTSSLPILNVHPKGSPLPLSLHEAMNNLAQHFANISSSTPHNDHSYNMLNTIHEHIHDERIENEQGVLDDLYSEEEVKVVCDNVKLQSALGPDEFSPYFLRHASPAFISAFTSIINFSWQHGVIPVGWKDANICPLFKGKDNPSSSPDSYRPISLTSIPCKVTERLVAKRIWTIFKPCSLQAGFRSHFSTTNNHSSLQSHIHLGRLTRRVVAFLDLSKAFDKVWIAGLLYKLRRIGINGRCYRWIRAFLIDRRIRIVIRSQQSDWFYITAGVPQGAVLSPLLFLIYIDDISIPRSISSPVFIIWLFADDIAVSSRDAGVDGDAQLQIGLSHIMLWCDTWLSHLNFSKSVIVIFSTNKNSTLPPPPPFHMNNKVLAVKSSFHYLGLTYSSNFKWQQHYINLLNRINTQLRLILRIITNTTPILTAITLIRALIIPTISFGMPFWRPTLLQCTHLQSRIVHPLRLALHLPASTHHLSILTECGILSPSMLWPRSALIYNHHCRQLPLHHPSVIMMSKSKTHLPWHTQLVKTLREWKINDASISVAGINSAASSQHLQLWRNSGKCKDYIQLHHPTSLSTPFYIRHDLPHHSRLRARLRLNRSYLNDSLFRRNISPSPLCSICHVPETPAHLLTCPLYLIPRRRLIADMTHLPPVNILLGELPRSTSSKQRRRHIHLLHCTGKFLSDVSSIRQL